MASPASISLILFILILGLTIGVNARPGMHFHPCRSFFISYSYTFSTPKNPLKFSLETPTNPISNPESNPDSSGFIEIYRDFKFPGTKPINFSPSDMVFYDKTDVSNLIPVLRHPSKPFHHENPGNFGVSSIRERTKDILSVVIALLFGVGCGALTSATMYLAWSLITHRYETGNSDDETSTDGLGYVKIPAAPAPNKEGYEGN